MLRVDYRTQQPRSFQSVEFAISRLLSLFDPLDTHRASKRTIRWVSRGTFAPDLKIRAKLRRPASFRTVTSPKDVGEF